MAAPKALLDLFLQVVTDIWNKYGPFAALLILLIVAFEYRMTQLWRERLADKDREIERLVKERNKLQDVVLKNRLSSRKH